MALPVSGWGNAGADITGVGFAKASGDSGSVVASTGGAAAYPSSISSSVQYTWPVDLPPNANYWVELKYELKDLSKTQRIGPTGRGAVNTRDFYLARIYYIAFASQANLQLFKAVGGTFTQLGSNYAFNVSAGGTYTVRLDMNGTTIRALLDGTQRISVTDSSHSGAGRAGIYNTADVAGSDTQGFHIDEFTTSFAAAGTTYFQTITATTFKSASVDKTSTIGKSMSASISKAATIARQLALSQTMQTGTSKTASINRASVLSQSMSAAISKAASAAAQYLEGAGVPATIKRWYGMARSVVLSVLSSNLDRGD